LLQQVESLPAVESASAINHLPIAGDIWTLGFTVDGRPTAAPGEGLSAAYRIVRPNYFQTMRISLLKGRDFTERDAVGTPGVAIINETLARNVFPDEEPIGKLIRVNDGGPNPRAIVGLVKDVKQRDWTSEPGREMYLPYLQNPAPNYLTLMIRTKTDPSTLAAAVRSEVWALDKDVPVSQVMTVEKAIADAMAQPRFNMLLLNIFSALALILAAIGIYGVMSYAVTQRTHEIGIRMAMGAGARDVIGLVVGQAVALALIGVGIGLAAALVLGRVISGLLFGVSPSDLLTFVVVSAMLTGVALGASFIPARRATKVDPMVALRYE
jgi:putative ABC transport system permease protein